MDTFSPNDYCCLKENEQDIELLPKGLEVMLTNKVGSFWYARAIVNNTPRIVLVTESNLIKRK